MDKGEFISKEESMMLQGIAAMLMVFHHLFAFPDRIDSIYVMLFDFKQLHLETIISYWGRICIAIFAFNSGYGLCKLACKNICRFRGLLTIEYKNVVARILKLYLRLWVVCLIFIPIGIIQGKYKFDMTMFFRSMIGISYKYNGEWWYLGIYFKLLLLFPIMFFLLTILDKVLNKLQMYLFFSISILSFCILYYKSERNAFITYLLCFIIGMFVVYMNMYEEIYSYIKKGEIPGYILAIFLLIFSFLLRNFLQLNCDFDFIFVPVIVFSILIFLKSNILKRFVNSVLKFVGTYSTYIWLTHTFYAYYYFQKVVYSFRYSTLIFIWCMILSTVTGIVLEYVVSSIEKRIRLKR